MAFVRQVVQAKYGEKFNRYFYKGTAEGSRKAFMLSRYRVFGTPTVNDIVFWKGTKNQPEGHVAIVGDNGVVYENSSLHWTALQGAKGTRRLESMRKPDMIVRLR
jgi:surface antigen